MFEIIDRDASARLGEWTVGKHKIKTPTIAIVVNPNRQVIPPEVMKKMGVELIITNSYIINKKPETRKMFSKRGLHASLNWDGPIYTDSGTFQMFSQSLKDLPNKKIIQFQKKIKSDIITPVDVFTLPKDDLKIAKKKLTETIKRIKEAKSLVRNFNAPIQGGRHLALRKQACQKLAKVDPLIYSIGGIVPYMEQYRFTKLGEIILTCKGNLPPNYPVHAFGAGHPMVFAFLTALGCDVFDSAMYSLAAQRGAYLTVRGTLEAASLREFPCTCPACSCTTVKEFKSMSLYQKEKFLTLHNLYVTVGEIRTVRQAIRNDRLWELVQQRARAHPKLLEALHAILKNHGHELAKNEKLSKSAAFFYSGVESSFRPEVFQAKERAKFCSGKKTKHLFWDKVPVGLRDTYPFLQSIVPGGVKYPQIKPAIQLRTIIDYQFGKGASKKFTSLQLEVSKKTHRIRRVRKQGKFLGSIRPQDGLFIPSFDGAKLLGKYIRKVDVRDREVAGFIKIGKSLFARFAYPENKITPGQEVLVTLRKKPLALGTALLSTEEMKSFSRGMAVKIRKTIS
jgi:7-cyano-7-deazaguanine tRNA-ribosyltransferase